jgi:glycosyltransferase involved in cell wall biosynthesis
VDGKKEIILGMHSMCIKIFITPEMENPLVSVLMTAYNRERYIAEAIESVLSSTYKNFELVIVDDCSADETFEIAKKYEQKDTRVRVYRNKTNLGQFKNRNTAASFAKGEYIKYFDSDDVMNNNLLEITMQAMQSFPQASVGIECRWPKIPAAKLPVLFSSREAYVNHFFKGNDFLHYGPSSSVIRKKLFGECNGYDEKVGILADTLLMLQLAAKSPVVGYKPDLFHWRRHDGQVTVEQDNYYEMFCQRHEINTIILNSEIPFTPGEAEIVKQNLKNIFIRNIFKYIWSIKNPIKLYNMIKIRNIRLIDIFRALSKNKIVEY